LHARQTASNCARYDFGAKTRRVGAHNIVLSIAILVGCFRSLFSLIGLPTSVIVHEAAVTARRRKRAHAGQINLRHGESAFCGNSK
jgi:hypothetical protein